MSAFADRDTLRTPQHAPTGASDEIDRGLALLRTAWLAATFDACTDKSDLEAISDTIFIAMKMISDGRDQITDISIQ